MSKTIVITGGAIGLGRELTRLYCEKGHRVIICGRTGSALEEVRAVHQNATAVCADLAAPEGRRLFLDEIHALETGVDLLVHNAALQFKNDFRQGCVPVERVETELAVNLLAPIELTADLLPLLKQSVDARIAFISSALGRVPKRSAPVYCASKAGLSTFARSLRYQLEGSRIRVTDVIPDLIVTRMTSGRGDKALSAFEAAKKIVAGLEKGRDEIRLGRVSKLYLLQRIAPSLAYRLLKAA